jgi:hypothetical protein
MGMHRFKWHRLPLTVLAVGIVAAVIGFAIVVSGSDDTRSPGAASPRTPLKGGAAFLQLAGHVPLEDAELGFSFFDYARVRELTGIAAPEASEPQETVRRHIEALSLKAVTFTTPVSRFANSTEWNREIGFNFASVDQVLWTTARLGSPYVYVVAGALDPSRIENALLTDSSVSGSVRPIDYEGTTYLSWEKLKPPNAVWQDNVRVILKDGLIVSSSDTGMIERSIEAADYSRLSLHHLPELDAIAAAIDRLGIYLAICDIDFDSWYSDYRDLIEGEYGLDVVESQLALNPYESLMVGVGQDGSSAYAVMILVHADGAAAQANAEKLHQIVASGISFHSHRPWKDVIDKAEFEAVDNLVYGKLYAGNLRLTIDAWNNLDSLFLQ